MWKGAASFMTASHNCYHHLPKSLAMASPSSIPKCSMPGRRSCLNSGNERTAMTGRYRIGNAISGPLFVLVCATVLAGDWATITIAIFPEYAVAGEPLNLTFTIRQHGQPL